MSEFKVGDVIKLKYDGLYEVVGTSVSGDGGLYVRKSHDSRKVRITDINMVIGHWSKVTPPSIDDVKSEALIFLERVPCLLAKIGLKLHQMGRQYKSDGTNDISKLIELCEVAHDECIEIIEWNKTPNVPVPKGPIGSVEHTEEFAESYEGVIAHAIYKAHMLIINECSKKIESLSNELLNPTKEPDK